MARALMEDVIDPRGVACITYNNECAIELETRLTKFGISSSDRNFIGTVHSFALTQVIGPYARCIPGLLPQAFRVASDAECRSAVEAAYTTVFNDQFPPHDRWAFAKEKRIRHVDRNLPIWRERNPELANFIEAYELELRHQGLIDFDDMPLIAFRMIKSNAWIRDALSARFPVLFVDEYQDLGHALHELVLLLCFEGGMRLFAVGDADQSIYGFNGANPELLKSLIVRENVREIRLRFNYRSGAKIIRASLGALGEERNYHSAEDALEGDLFFWKVNGGLDAQAAEIANRVLPTLLTRHPPEEIAILYRAAWLGDKIAQALEHNNVSFVRTDGNALIKRSSRLARLIEDCAAWVCGGWREANPSYSHLLNQTLSLVYAGRVTDTEEQILSRQLIGFLQSSISANISTHFWLQRFYSELITSWMAVSRNPHQEWGLCSEMIAKTAPEDGKDMPLNIFSGKMEGAGRINLSTMHSSKGREFDAVILYGMNASDIPSNRDKKSPASLRETRRLFYVGVTRPRKELSVVFQKDFHSPWVAELYQRSQKS